MKVGIPSETEDGLDSPVGYHFGRVPHYTIIDTDTDEVKVVHNQSVHMGGERYPAELLHEKGVEVMICGGLGGRAVEMFENMGIMVYVGASGTVKEAHKAWKDGVLEPATDENACREHKYHNAEPHHL